MKFVRNVLIIAAVFLTATLQAVEIYNGVNVKDFGAKGDGVTDDTIAIKKALRFMQSCGDGMLLARQPMVEDLPEMADLPALGTTTEATRCPELFFPAGQYIVSDTLVANSLFLRGEEGTEIIMTDPAKDILYLYWGFRVRISNITFSGGKRQVILYTGNNDTANFCVENCTFRNAAGYALWSHNYLRPGGYDFATMTMGPYDLDDSGEFPVLIPNREDVGYFANSTLITVDNCLFENCAGAIDMESDGMEITNCTISSGTLDRSPLKGAGRFVDMECIADSALPGVSWFNGGGDFLGGVYVVQDGSPCPLVNCTNPNRGEIPSALVIRDIFVSNGDAPLIQIFNAEKENSPFILDIDGVTTAGEIIPAVQWQVPFDLQRAESNYYTWQPALEAFNGIISMANPFCWSFANCPQLVTDNIPETLLSNQDAPIAADVLAAATADAVDVCWEEAEDTIILYGSDFGVDTDFNSDDTESMEKLFAAAVEAGKPVKIVLPPVLIRTSRPLALPVQAEITSHGLATIYQSDWNVPVFAGENTEKLYINQIRFLSGSNAIDVRPSVNGIILIDKSFFYQQKKASVNIAAGAGNNVCFALKRSTFISPVQGIDSDAASNYLRNFWVSTNGRQDRQGFLVNRGGDMLAHGMLGVPMPMKDHGRNHLPFVKDWPFANDLRWVDNYGRYHSEYSRYGGEYYGFVPVFNFSSSGTVVIEGSYACFGFPGCRNCIVFCEETPEIIIFRNFGWEFLREGQWAVKYADAEQAAAPVLQRNFLFNKKRIHE